VIEPLRFSFEVACAPEDAFDLWTQRAASWWPPEHTVSADPDAEVVFETRPGGRVFERTPGGKEIEWGEITVWEPPERLAYLWHIRVDRSDATEVEIRFRPEAGGTRVEIEHRGWERLGARGPSWRQVNRGGWDGVLPAYVAVCTEHAGRH
jgi:hypothetical protein